MLSANGWSGLQVFAVAFIFAPFFHPNSAFYTANFCKLINLLLLSVPNNRIEINNFVVRFTHVRGFLAYLAAAWKQLYQVTLYLWQIFGNLIKKIVIINLFLFLVYRYTSFRKTIQRSLILWQIFFNVIRLQFQHIHILRSRTLRISYVQCFQKFAQLFENILRKKDWPYSLSTYSFLSIIYVCTLPRSICLHIFSYNVNSLWIFERKCFLFS